MLWLWVHAPDSPGGSTLQWGVVQGLMCLTPHVMNKFTCSYVIHTIHAARQPFDRDKLGELDSEKCNSIYHFCCPQILYKHS